MINRIAILLLFSLLFNSFFAFSSMEKRMFVNTQSELYLTKSIDIESLSQGLVTEEMFYSLPRREKEDGSKIKFLITDSVIYAIELCRLNVWKWQDTGWHNLYKYSNKGWCINHFYLDDGKILGFTSGGFWTANSGIYIFDEQSGSWELKNVKNKIIPFLSAASFRMGNDTVISLINVISSQGNVKTLNSGNNFGYDVKAKKWFRVKSSYDLQFFDKFLPHTSIDFENTFHVFSSVFHLIVDKKSKKIYYERIKETAVKDPDFYFNDCTSGYMSNNINTNKWLDEVPNNSVLVGEMSFEELKESESKIQVVNNKSNYFNLFVAFLTLSIGISLGWYLKLLIRKINKLKGGSSFLLKNILANSGKNFTSEELDHLLCLDSDLNSDSLRVQRSRIIKKVNTEYQKLEGKDLITRQKDPKDKRYIIFLIEK